MSGEKTEKRTVRVRITGRVQGVGYRAWSARNANALGIAGWVRNNKRDGGVEALFSGAAEQVHEMLRRCYDGPMAAIVDDVAIIEEGGMPPAGFAVLPAA